MHCTLRSAITLSYTALAVSGTVPGGTAFLAPLLALLTPLAAFFAGLNAIEIK